MTTEPYFIFREGLYYPQSNCSGPWHPQSLTGSVIVALLAHGIELKADTGAYLPARLTVDMYHLPSFAPIEIQTRWIRDGHRIKVMDAEFISEGKSMARASCQLLRRTENPPTPIWKPAPWGAPLPEEIPATEGNSIRVGNTNRIINGNMGQYGRKQVWLSDSFNLVNDVPLSPWMRTALIADLTNPWANSGEGRVSFINSDVTLYLHRLPCDEWLGMDVVNHQSTAGIAIGECHIHDRQGLIGSSLVTGLAQKR